MTPLLVEGETLDVQFAGKRNQIGEADVVDMLWKKTGVLYEFAGRAGAAIALNTADSGVPAVRSLAQFCSLCGTAFQIQDDILGVVGDTRQLGKPVGSDIREGKSTLLTLKALQLADEGQRARIQSTLGNAEANDAAISDVAQLLRDLGVIKYAQDISHKYVDKALEHLQPAARQRIQSLVTKLGELSHTARFITIGLRRFAFTSVYCVDMASCGVR